MLTKIKRQDCLKEYPSLSTRIYNKVTKEKELHYPKIAGRHVLTLPSKFYKVYCKLLGIELTYMAKELNCKRLIFLEIEKDSWLSIYNDYKQAKDAVTYLETMKWEKGLMVLYRWKSVI